MSMDTNTKGVSFEVFDGTYKQLLEASIQDGLIAVGEQALADSNFYVREDQSDLKRSAEIRRNGKVVNLTYNTPYAKRVYYTGKPSHDKNMNASLMWIEKAYNSFKSDWQRIFEKAFAKKMGGAI